MIKYMYDFNALRIPTAWNLEEHNLTVLVPASGTSLCLLDSNLLFTRLSIWYIPSVWKWFSFGNVSWIILKLHSVYLLSQFLLSGLSSGLESAL